MEQHPGSVFAQICLLAASHGPPVEATGYAGSAWHRFDTLDELVRTIYQAMAYWNRHRYPYVWDRRLQRVRLMVPKTIVRSTCQIEIINTWT